jgi:hypothetical protein
VARESGLVTIDFSSCTARVEWSEKAIQELNEVSRRDAKSKGEAPLRPELLETATFLASNTVHQLRSALDNLVWLLVLLNAEAPGIHTAFPVQEVNNRSARKKIQRRLQGVRANHASVIEGLQPYHADADDVGNHPLKILNDLWNADKHRVLPVTLNVPATFTFAGSPRPIPGLVLVYEDGRETLPTLRKAHAAVDVIFSAFRPALDGLPVEIDFRPVIVNARVDYFQRRDPIGTYQADLDYFYTWLKCHRDENWNTLPHETLAEMRDRTRRLLASPFLSSLAEYVEQGDLIERVKATEGRLSEAIQKQTDE